MTEDVLSHITTLTSHPFLGGMKDLILTVVLLTHGTWQQKKKPRRSEDLETTAGREGANSVQMKVAAEHDLANYYSECTGLNL